MNSQNTGNRAQGQLVREFGLGAAIILFVSSIIGSGVYKKVAQMSIDTGGSPSLVLLAWLLAGLVTLFGVLTTAEIGGVITDSGGPYAYFKRIYGRMFAFYYGWSSFSVIQSASIASIAYVFAQSVNSLVPLPVLGGKWEAFSLLGGLFIPFANLGVKVVAVALIALLAAVNYRGVKEGGLVSKIITIIVVASLALIVLLGLSIGGGSMENVQRVASTYPPAAFATNLGFISVMFTAMLGAFWAYEGWINLGFIGEEVKNPQRTIPLALIIGILIVIAIYLGVNFTYLYVMPIDEMYNQLTTLNPDGTRSTNNNIAAIEVVRSFMGSSGAVFISMLIIVTTIGCTNATILTAARVYYAMARHGLFTGRANYIHPRFNTPSNALLMQSVWASILVFSGSFDQLTDMLIFASFIFYGSIAAGVFVLRRKEPDTPRPYRVIGYPIVPLIFVLFCIVLIFNTLLTRPREAGIGLFLILIGTPFYFYWKRKYGNQSESGFNG
jgi:APA family basic amino acid/polyamine antiporter